MANLASALKDEITRLARKEIRTQVDPLRKASANHRREIAELKRQIADLSRQVKAASKAPKAAPEAPPTGKTRFSSKGLKTLRKRLGLSAEEFGLLAGASSQSIYNWEADKTLPREAQRATLVSLRGLGKKEARARLEALEK
jgi:DNA-binding transcriptional regulator YiaG